MPPESAMLFSWRAFSVFLAAIGCCFFARLLAAGAGGGHYYNYDDDSCIAVAATPSS